MRTTLNLDEDALEIARARARRRNSTLGEAVSELIRRAVEQPVWVVDRDGFTVPQVIDVYLLALARAHGGVLATFDTGLRGIASKDLLSVLETVPPAG